MLTKLAKYCCLFVLASSCVFAGDGEKDGRIRYTSLVTGTPRLKGVMSPQRDLYKEDLEVLRDWGVTLVRFQICRNWFQIGTDTDLPEYDAWFNSRLKNFEEMLPVARSLGIRFVLDLHSPPGGLSAFNVMRMFEKGGEKYADHFVGLWRKIAERFKNHPDKAAIWGYDLVNEPQLSPDASARDSLRELLIRAGEAIRAIDENTVLIVSPERSGAPRAYAGYRPLPFRDVIYQVHAYDPFLYTYQFVLPETTPADGAGVEYPGLIDGEFWSRSRLGKEKQPVIDFQKRYGARIYIGEFSAISWAPNADVWLFDSIGIFDQYGWDYTYHAFREWDGFSLEHEGRPPHDFWPSRDNLRKKAVLNAFKRK